MATFKVGQRVKRIGGCIDASYPAAPVGLEGTVLTAARQALGCTPGTLILDVRFDDGREWACVPHSLAPLTDPAADAFVERIKRMEREPAPRVKESA
jgi:hypothetical protein